MALNELQILTLPECSDSLVAEAIAVESGLENYFFLFSRSPQEIWVYVHGHPEMDRMLYASVHAPQFLVSSLDLDKYGIEYGKEFDPTVLEPGRLTERMKLLLAESADKP